MYSGNRKPIVITAAIIVVVCIAVAVVILITGRITEKRLAAQLELAESCLSELDYEGAMDAYEEAVRIDPKCEDAYLGLADIYIKQEEYEKAEEILEEALDQIESRHISKKLEEAEEAAEEAAAGRVPYVVEMAAIADASVGDIVYWGSYEQDNDLTNGTEPVAWYVLDKAGREATLLSVDLLDCEVYHETWDKEITWEDCALRSWLNSEFYHTAFSEKEQAAIANANVVNEDNPYYDTEGGNDTADKVWLLSLGEVERYFHIDMDVWDDYSNGNMDWYEYAIYCYGQDNRVCAKATAYAEARGVYVYLEEDAQYEMEDGYDTGYAIGSGVWWLRSPGDDGNCATGIDGIGYVYFYGVGVDNNGGVRPALKVAY